MSSRLGVVYIATSERAEKQQAQSERSLRNYHDWPVKILNLNISGEPVKSSRALKTRLFEFSPFDYTLYLDADTRVMGDVSAGFDILDAGFDIVITPSVNQGKECLWHLSEIERTSTFEELGIIPLQLQAGVFWFKKNYRTECMFSNWQTEWGVWYGEDQGAFLRALYSCPLKIWLLGRPFNGGAVVKHLFGFCRNG